jgi:chorismate mutase
MMVCRGIRGATTVEHNEEQEILAATAELLSSIVAENGIVPDEIGSVIVTVTGDLDATFPARAIRDMNALEVPVQGSLPRCIRLMVMANTTKSQTEIVHVYLNEAQALRPDLAKR